MQDSRQQWLDSLDPRVRAEVEAKIAEYEHPDIEECIDIDEDWQLSPNATFKVVPDPPPGVWFDLEFTTSEYDELMQAVGEADPFEFIKAAALARARGIFVERDDAGSATVFD